MKYIFAFVLMVGSRFLIAQTNPVAPALTLPDNKKATLEERFQYMKSKAETYQDYKVIKAVTLDAEWKIVMDSIQANKAIWQDVKKSIGSSQAELKNAQQALKEKEASMTEVIYGSEHISFMGISFSKKSFVILCVLLIGGLAFIVVLMAGKLKLMHSSSREKTDLAETTLKEFEEYKQKALDKQAKLSRELQNERNKLSEQRHS